ncbi:MAG TPA: phospho-sugar mutase [Galbitalea sp.]|jgi:phosphomannomutase|nr:phospho-sugar mutase [Galbitalea sp.]
MSESETLAAARAWLDQDPDDETRDELGELLKDAESGSAEAMAQLHDRFDLRLEFGTAGLRGAIGAGPNRMNRVLVSQAAAGLAAYLLSTSTEPSVVVGYDGRKNSRVFAEDTAEIMAGAGVRAILLPRLLPTPVLAFAVRHLDTSAGVMVTASHNPGTDNGYKVYLGGADAGSQIVPPTDGLIATEIEKVATGDIRSLPRSLEYEVAGEDVVHSYVTETAAVGSASAQVKVVYTAMHGVGWETARRVFLAAGFDEPTVVSEQIEPDADFPTVTFPNPEEPGALDLAFDRAREVEAELIIANDPDADRLAVGVPTADGWRRLSGNEVGLMLGWRAAGRATSGTLACSIVSSPGLAAVADAKRLTHLETLTGFKWISRAPDLVFGFEEALGYLVDPDVVRDKDGISAAVDLLALASELKANGKTLADHAEDLAGQLGAFASAQISLRFSDLSEIPRLMQRLRSKPPKKIGGVDVRVIDDFENGFGDFPPNDILRMWMTDGSRIVVRPSGTEPKLKVYIDSSSTDGGSKERMAGAEARVGALDAAMRALLA